MDYQLPLFQVEPEPQDKITCELHGWFDPRAYYTEKEIEQMKAEQGFIDCPQCLAEIAGISW